MAYFHFSHLCIVHVALKDNISRFMIDVVIHILPYDEKKKNDFLHTNVSEKHSMFDLLMPLCLNTHFLKGALSNCIVSSHCLMLSNISFGRKIFLKGKKSNTSLTGYHQK